jgi:hypothetical protein
MSEEMKENENAADEKKDAAEEKSGANPDAERAEESAVPRTEVDKLYREMKRWKERARAAEARLEAAPDKDKRIAELEGMVGKIRIDEQLRAAAAKRRAVDPAEIAGLLRAKVTLSKDLEPAILGENGEPRMSSSGEPLKIGDLVGEYLSAHPHHVKSTGLSGAGTVPRAARPETMGEKILRAKDMEELEGIIVKGS